MAVQGSGLGKGPDSGAMKEQTSYDARSGAAKKTQTSFPQKWGMRDRISFDGAGPSSPGSGPDASSPNPLDPEPRGKVLRRQPTSGNARTPWGQKGAADRMAPSQQVGNTYDPSLSGKVLGEAIISGSSKLPGSTSEASGPGVKYTGRDPN
jgi:hypothetical protein